MLTRAATLPPCTQVMHLVEYLDDRSQFFTAYADALARRLIGRTSYSRSLEAHALALLRPSAPYELASRLNRMVADVKVRASLIRMIPCRVGQIQRNDTARRAVAGHDQGPTSQPAACLPCSGYPPCEHHP